MRPIVCCDSINMSFRPADSPAPVDPNHALIVGVAGGGSSGKQAVCSLIQSMLLGWDETTEFKVTNIKMEDFYYGSSQDPDEYNFDHPEAVNFERMHDTLTRLQRRLPVEIPIFDFNTHTLSTDINKIDNADVVIISGIHLLYSKEIRKLLTLKVFVDVDSDVRLAKQVIRDTSKRYNLKLEKVLARYMKFVKPSFEEFILPSKKYADVIIPRGEGNTVAITLLAQHILDVLSSFKK